jgi:hypothetical protein
LAPKLSTQRLTSTLAVNDVVVALAPLGPANGAGIARRFMIRLAIRVVITLGVMV